MRQLAPPAQKYSPQAEIRLSLKHLLAYLVEVKIVRPPKPKRIVKPYSWHIDPYFRYLRQELELSEHTVKYRYQFLDSFLDSFGHNAERTRLNKLQAETVERLIKEHFKNSTANPGSPSGDASSRSAKVNSKSRGMCPCRHPRRAT